VRFRTTSDFDREYLRNALRYRQAENGVINYNLFHVRIKNWVYNNHRVCTANVYPIQSQQCARLRTTLHFSRKYFRNVSSNRHAENGVIKCEKTIL